MIALSKNIISPELEKWLEQIGKVHFQTVELGLARIKKVSERMDLSSWDCPVIIVGGTNGKGSTVATLEAIYLRAGYRVGSFTSPFLFRINEQIKINGQSITDAQLIDAFEKIQQARGNITLTPFEFHTLAALIFFKAAKLDMIILEVGLGGRLDAVNILDANVAIITSIALDHTELLGTSREAIAYEKVGIARANHFLVCGDFNPPTTLINYVNQLPVKKSCYQQQDFYYQKNPTDWDWVSETYSVQYQHLPYTGLKCQNMATACMAITLLQPHLPVNQTEIQLGLSQLHLPGRIQINKNKIYDVAHNPAAITYLADRLMRLKNSVLKAKRYLAVFSMLADKDIINSLLAITSLIDVWYVAPLATKRAATKAQLIYAFQQANIQSVIFLPDIKTAYQRAVEDTQINDHLVIFGSFHTVAESLQTRN